MNRKYSKQPGNHSLKKSLENLAFFAGSVHDCGYLPGRPSASLFADPAVTLDMEIFNALLEHGFRRSGNYVYRPHCPTCKACLAARIPVEVFKPNRNQTRLLSRQKRRKGKGHGEIFTKITEPAFREEQFALYCKYMSSRHAGGGMDDASKDKYMEFLSSSWTRTEFVEFRLEDKLLAIAVTDVLPAGLSSVYTFFDPDYAELSLGRHALLWQIGEAKHRQLPYLYLGYWIRNCQKMLYKQEYRPIELYLDNHWKRFDRQQALPVALGAKPS